MGKVADVLIVLGFSLVAFWVLLNLMTGCDSWDAPNCVTPKQLWNEVIYDVD